MSNLKLVAGTVKRRGIAIAAAVAVAGGSLATANYAMAVETDAEFEALQQEFHTTEAGNSAAQAVFDAATALKSGKTESEVQAILKEGLQKAAASGDAGFTQADIDDFDQDKLNEELKGIVDSGKATLQKKNSAQSEQPQGSVVPEPQAPAPSPADWATPAPAGDPSPQRLEAEFGGTREGKVAEDTAKQLAELFRGGKTKQEAEQIVKTSFKKAGLEGHVSDSEVSKFVEDAFTRYHEAETALQFKKDLAQKDLTELDKLNPLQRKIFQDQINAATKQSEIITVLNAAKAENENPVEQFAPLPGQKAPGKAGEKTDVEKALEYTKEEALKKLEGFTFLTQQQKDAYTKAVNEATQVYQVEAAFETGKAKNTANKAAKEATNFVGKALARTKQLALKQLDSFTNLTHEQKREARNKIVAATQVFEVEAAFHTAEKLNKAAK